jgi:cysteine synthase
MSLPNTDRAVVDPAKVRDYLLAAAHPVGRFKARFFISLGYAAEQWARLRDDILILARAGAVSSETAIAYGRKFEVDGILTGPSGGSATVRSVWIIRTGEDFPRLVTVFPR